MKHLITKIATILTTVAVTLTAVPCVSAYAATDMTQGKASSTEELQYESSSKSTICASAYNYGTITSLDQSGATATSITMSWTDAAFSTSDIYTIDYNVYYAGNKVGEYTQTVTGVNTFTITGLTAGNYIYFHLTKNSSDYGSYYYAQTKPSSVQRYSSSYPWYTYGGGKKLQLYFGYDSYNNYVVDGAAVTLYSASGKKLGTNYTTKYGIGFVHTKAKSAAKPYKAVIKFYFQSAGGKKFYGPCKTLYCVPQPKYKKSTHTSSKLSVNWKKVSGAQYYIVYVARKRISDTTSVSDLKFKKIGKTKGTSYTITRSHGSAINTRKYSYFIHVITKAKVGGKTVKSRGDYYLYS